jgi:hypothetical protein
MFIPIEAAATLGSLATIKEMFSNDDGRDAAAKNLQATNQANAVQAAFNAPHPPRQAVPVARPQLPPKEG